MEFRCPVNYDINKCSSKEYGLTCETCFHYKDISRIQEKIEDSICNTLSENDCCRIIEGICCSECIQNVFKALINKNKGENK